MLLRGKARLTALLLFLGMKTVTFAEASIVLAKKHNCFACHMTHTRLVGPAYKDISKKYANDSNAAARLIIKVKTGSKGVWGSIPMPPNAHLSDSDAKALVQWILLLK